MPKLCSTTTGVVARPNNLSFRRKSGFHERRHCLIQGMLRQVSWLSGLRGLHLLPPFFNDVHRNLRDGSLGLGECPSAMIG